MVAQTLAAIPLESAIWAALHDVHDPEIPTISVVDLGVVRSVTATRGASASSCCRRSSAARRSTVLQDSIAERLREFAKDVRVEISFAEPWTTERISPDGRAALRAAGFAPPAARHPDESRDLRVLPVMPVAQCPYCGSRNTTLENAFGPTLCRAIYHCADCRQPFEQFKEV